MTRSPLGSVKSSVTGIRGDFHSAAFALIATPKVKIRDNKKRQLLLFVFIVGSQLHGRPENADHKDRQDRRAKTDLVWHPEPIQYSIHGYCQDEAKQRNDLMNTDAHL